MEMYQDGVHVLNLPDNARCELDEYKRSLLEIEQCPEGKEYCTGDCFYYTEEDQYGITDYRTGNYN